MLGNSSPFICSAELQLRNRCPTMYQTSTPHLIVTHTNSKHVVLSCCNLNVHRLDQNLSHFNSCLHTILSQPLQLPILDISGGSLRPYVRKPKRIE